MVNIGDVVLDIPAEVSANLAIALEEVFEIDGPDFDFLGMHSVINAFCQKYNITGKLETAQQLTDRMLNDIMAAYRPITVRITHSEQSAVTALDFMVEKMTITP